MPRRLTPLVNGEIYHIYNRGIDHRTTFLTPSDYKRAIFTLKYYQYKNIPGRLSYLNKYPFEQRSKILLDIYREGSKLSEIVAYVLMANHFHLVVRQVEDGGIRKLVGNFQNSYTKYFNTKNKRDGALFLDQFKAVRVETEEQFKHVVRYIHLNPFSSYVVKNEKELIEYLWSSFPEYLGLEKDGFCDKKMVLGMYKNIESYKKFCLDQADYQRGLESVKHLLMDI